ncbi:hypothetical protein [Haladaptatus sp. NG-SE-30]
MRRETLIIGTIVALILLPMWYIGLHGEPPSEEIAIDSSVSEIRPLAGFIDTPNKLSPSQVGVIVWVALFALFGVLVAAHRFMNVAVRPERRIEVASDGGQMDSLRWFQTEDRWIVEYRAASSTTEGIVVMGALTVLAIVFSALFTGEYLTLARTQYFGLYATGLFLSLTALTVAYYAWFIPHVEVIERRGH